MSVRFVDIATEQTTAATDLLLAGTALIGSLVAGRLVARDRWRAGLWTGVFALVGAAALVGTATHGLVMPNGVEAALFGLMNLCLGVTMALFVAAAASDWRGVREGRRVLPAALVFAAVFLLFTVVIRGTFTVFIVYESVALVFALLVYGSLGGRLAGARWIALGVALTLAAAVIQVSAGLLVTIYRPFDHNGLFHVVQVVAISVLIVGVRKRLRETGEET